MNSPAPAIRALTRAEAYRLRWKRKRLLWRAFRARRQLSVVADRTAQIRPDDILAVIVQRNEAARLPYFLSHYRRLGVSHFLVVDNGSDDGSDRMLAAQDDVSVWRSTHGYRDARFGLDWSTWLQIRHAHGHWCLTVDADEVLIYPEHEAHGLPELTAWLDRNGRAAFGALMLDLYPKGPLGAQSYAAGQDPTEVLRWFDAGPYRARRQAPLGNLWVQGGVRERAFFADQPERSPTLNKLPLVKWDRRFVYVNSTHSMLPPALNAAYDGPGGTAPSGVLLHTKFLPEIVSKSEMEKQRGQHFHTPSDFGDYYDRIVQGPDLWAPQSVRLTGAAQLEELGLMQSPAW
ncbi:glycosyltransferase family 2 protein [Thalassovita taeanensis]|uniref:Glycosyl transferase family 2 n=1 Tax=Thalassovita taeanensis TaxID=657014 RepID=A0A1H9BUT4_9RHOB|nr:glycosyltransferase family 2 protein [Thalassovita taeanensis]SEP92597.1 Glycosyl transferase family 2 [Thalassovita taeanensis]